MKTKVRKKCPSWGHWNRFEAEKLFIEPESDEPGVHVFLPAEGL